MTADAPSLEKEPAQHSFFRPQARLVSLLGEQLIRDSAVGLLELVKNSYDADATLVSIKLENLSTPEETIVIVEDNGHGMSAEHVRKYWLSPATGHKEARKDASERTPLGRQLLGEKGVGRFAVQRLGKKVELVTRAPNENEVVVQLDWAAFEEDGAFLDEVEVRVGERRPEVFRGKKTGTRLTMQGTRDRWTGVELSRVQRMLRRLQNPVRRGNDFTVSFSCPDRPEYEDIDPANILDTAHYSFTGSVDKSGRLDWRYSSDLPGGVARTNSGTDELRDIVAEELSNEEPECGPFSIQLHVWDRRRDKMKAVGLTDRELDSHCGISIYRDGFRVLPYGEAGDDWLGLDARRINVPSKRVGNRNLIGLVEISHEENRKLQDKTSREGLQESKAYHDLKALVRGAIMTLEIERLRDRKVDSETVGSSSRFALADRGMRSLGQQQASEAGNENFEDCGSDEQLTRQARHNISVQLQRARKETQMNELFHLANCGLRLERLGVEFSRQARSANLALSKLKTLIPDDAEANDIADELSAHLNVLRNGLRDLVPDGLVVQRERTTERAAAGIIDTAIRLNSSDLTSHKIEVKVCGRDDELIVRARPSLVVQVLDNLINNAVYWMSVRPANEERVLLIACDSKRQRILVGDSGPGVAHMDRERIFEPYFSKKPEGFGLGLHICQERLQSVGAQMYLVDPTEATALHDRGATFCVQF